MSAQRLEEVKILVGSLCLRGKEDLTVCAGDLGLIPRLRRSLEKK